MYMICRTCLSRLSTELLFVQPSERNVAFGEDLVRAGTITQEDGSYFRNQIGI